MDQFPVGILFRWSITRKSTSPFAGSSLRPNCSFTAWKMSGWVSILSCGSCADIIFSPPLPTTKKYTRDVLASRWHSQSESFSQERPCHESYVVVLYSRLPLCLELMSRIKLTCLPASLPCSGAQIKSEVRQAIACRV